MMSPGLNQIQSHFSHGWCHNRDWKCITNPHMLHCWLTMIARTWLTRMLPASVIRPEAQEGWLQEEEEEHKLTSWWLTMVSRLDSSRRRTWDKLGSSSSTTTGSRETLIQTMLHWSRWGTTGTVVLTLRKNALSLTAPQMTSSLWRRRMMWGPLWRILTMFFWTSLSGAGGSPLAYVTREDVTLPESPTLPGEDDPGVGLPTLQEELIRRTRHEGAHYASTKRIVAFVATLGGVWP